MRNPFGKSYGPSARQQYLAKGSERAQDAQDMVDAAKQVAAEKRQAKQQAAKVGAAKAAVSKCNKAKLKPGAMKCGVVGSGIYCNKHSKQGRIITEAG